jgi:stage V sporulation protein R
MQGRDKIFEVRAIYNDVSFIDEFLTPEFVDRHKMHHDRRDPRTNELRVVSRDFEQIKQTLLYRLSNSGQPFIFVVDANYLNRGELFLAHQWNGLDLEIRTAVETLRSLRTLWRRPVHLQARIEDEMWLFSCADPAEQVKREKITDSTPKPAHLVV